MTELTKEQKIAKIYAEIADKTRSLGCKYYYFQDGDDYEDVSINLVGTATVNGYNDKHPLLEKHIIGHPVMIGDVLDRIEGKLEDNHFLNFYIEDLIMDICNKRKEKRKPIEEQDENCISFVYSLIKNPGQN